jgi:hypothetical protein
MALTAGSKGERATVVGVALVTGGLVGLTDKKKPKWTTGVTLTGLVVGLGMIMFGKGIVQTIGEGIATGTAASIGASIPGWMGITGTGTSRRVAAPVVMAAPKAGGLAYDMRTTQPMQPNL